MAANWAGDGAIALLSGPDYRTVRLIDRKREQIRKIIEFLDGRGDPDILRIIEQEDEDEDE